MSITGVNIGRLFGEGFSNYDPIGALNAMTLQRTKEARGGDYRLTNYFPPAWMQQKPMDLPNAMFMSN